MTRALFVADQFSEATRTRGERHPGGAELTDDVAIRACPWPISAITFSALGDDPKPLAQADVILVGNSESARPEQLARIATTARHVTFEHDLRICRWRGNFPSGRDPLHRSLQRCWCPHLEQRALFGRARGVIFLTELQQRYYRDNRWFACTRARVLGSSLFAPELLEQSGAHTPERSASLVFASPNKIKGHAQALRYCRQHAFAAREIRGLAPSEVLRLFTEVERFVYLPIGPEWAGRMVVEARLLGAKVVANELVGVVHEAFWSRDRAGALDELSARPARFWQLVEELMNAPETALERSASVPERAAETLTKLLGAPRHRFWPAGPPVLGSARRREYAPW